MRAGRAVAIGMVVCAAFLFPGAGPASAQRVAEREAREIADSVRADVRKAVAAAGVRLRISRIGRCERFAGGGTDCVSLAASGAGSPACHFVVSIGRLSGRRAGFPPPDAVVYGCPIRRRPDAAQFEAGRDLVTAARELTGFCAPSHGIYWCSSETYRPPSCDRKDVGVPAPEGAAGALGRGAERHSSRRSGNGDRLPLERRRLSRRHAENAMLTSPPPRWRATDREVATIAFTAALKGRPDIETVRLTTPCATSSRSCFAARLGSTQ